MMMSNDNTKKEIAIVAITKHGIDIAKRIKNSLNNGDVYVPRKFDNSDPYVMYFDDSVTQRMSKLFVSYGAIVCIFSLGAVIRLISPLIKDKKTDPAILVIDDKAKFVISALSGHLGGANELTESVSSILGSIAVITTAADVNKTISIDLLGKKFGWIIDNFENVTKVSAMMVNEESIGVFQDGGEKNWWDFNTLPSNVEVVREQKELLSTKYKGIIIITDKTNVDQSLLNKSVIYRPKSLVVGIGLHWNTTKETIDKGVKQVFAENHLSFKSIGGVASLERGKPIKGLNDFCKEYNLPLYLFPRSELDSIKVPNPSELVNKYEGTPSVSEASSIVASKGILIVPKTKFPPDLTVAISRVIYK